MDDYKDFKPKQVMGRFPRIGKFIKPYGGKEYEADLTDNYQADMAGDIERFGDDITEEEYLSK